MNLYPVRNGGCASPPYPPGVGTRLVSKMATRIAIVLACAVAAIAVNLTILHRTPTDPIGNFKVAPVTSTPAP